jgi:hypothetical protein
MADGEWVADLRAAARLPLGVVSDPRHLTAFTLLDIVQNCSIAADILVARALQLQARGDPAAALDLLGVVLALGRNLQNRGVTMSYVAGNQVEGMALMGFDWWRKNLGREPDLLWRALDQLERHEAATPPFTDAIKADYVPRFLADARAHAGRTVGRGRGMAAAITRTARLAPAEPTARLAA